MNQQQQNMQSFWSDFINLLHKHKATLEDTSPNHPAPTLPGNTPITGDGQDTEGQDASGFNPNFRAVVADRVQKDADKSPKIKPSTTELKGEPSQDYKDAQQANQEAQANAKKAAKKK